MVEHPQQRAQRLDDRGQCHPQAEKWVAMTSRPVLIGVAPAACRHSRLCPDPLRTTTNRVGDAAASGASWHGQESGR
jgi:hypothetical protein